jgi:hypothetical protein
MNVASAARGTVVAGEERLPIAVVGSLAIVADIALGRFRRG